MRARVGIIAAVGVVGAFISIQTRAQPAGSPHETVKATIDGADVSIE